MVRMFRSPHLGKIASVSGNRIASRRHEKHHRLQMCDGSLIAFDQPIVQSRRNQKKHSPL
jgi:hypothetical protein